MMKGMKNKLDEFLKIEKEESDINQMSPLIWAYVGDSVFELYIRTKLVDTTNLKPHKLHIKAINYVKAKAQADMLNKIYESLTEEEKDIIRRGRNAENHHLPKNANVQDYMYATAFEALIGYLYLCKKIERVKEIIEKAVKTIDFYEEM